MSMDEKELKDAAIAALPELQAITLAISKVTDLESAVLQGLNEAFELGYKVGYASGGATILQFAEAVKHALNIKLPTTGKEEL